jgi:hypothetical protein
MFNYLENNWLRWYYDDNPSEIFRTSPEQNFYIDFDFDPTPCLDLRTETINACYSIRDTYPNEKFSLMLSGGSESEMLVRAFKEAKIPFKVYIGRYENNINEYDIHYAVKACESMDISYTFLDFNINRFFENDVVGVSLKGQIPYAIICAIMAMTDLVDGIPILGDGNPEVHRITKNYSKRMPWINVEPEYDYGRTKYFIKQNRPGISDWLRWSHTLLKSYSRTKWFKELTTDCYRGKLGVHSTKIQGYQEGWPELSTRIKKHGFEPVNEMVEEINKKLFELHNLSDRFNMSYDIHPLTHIYGNYLE